MPSGKLDPASIRSSRRKEAARESFIHVHVDRIGDGARETIVQGLKHVLADVTAAVQDWRPMLARVGDVLAELKTNPPPLPGDEVPRRCNFWNG